MTALTSIAIRHYQSLVDISLTLHPFTAIVGPTSSGKSAFVRALQTLTHNTRGSAFITQGKPGCTIAATLPTAVVSLIRTKSSSASDAYILSTGQGTSTDPIDTRRFTKLGGTTPPEVTQAFGQLADPTAIAAQFDPPYLLTQSPAEAARTLAALTGSDIVLNGAREANRQRLEAASSLRLRQQDIASTQDQLDTHHQHAAFAAHLNAAEPHLAKARVLQRKLGDLRVLTAAIDYQAHGIKILRTSLRQQPPIPDIAPLAALRDKISALRYTLANIQARAQSIRDLRNDINGTQNSIQDLSERHHALLVSLGTCPTCGAQTAQTAP